MKTFTIKSTREKEIMSAIQKNWSASDCIRVESNEVSGPQLVDIIQRLGLDSKQVVCVVCYGMPELWKKKHQAMDFYEEAWRSCEGSEAERYDNIWYKLRRNYKVATDQA